MENFPKVARNAQPSASHAMCSPTIKNIVQNAKIVSYTLLMVADLRCNAIQLSINT